MLLARYADAITALPEDPGRDDLFVDRFLMAREGKLEVYYAPFDWVNERARLVLCGIAPGWQQMQVAFRQARKDLLAGLPLGEVGRRAKQEARYAGASRAVLIRMLDGVGVHRVFDLPTSELLFTSEAGVRLHTTAVSPYPVFVDGKNYTGSNPALRASAVLTNGVRTLLGPELERVPDAAVIPVGKVAGEALAMLIADRRLDPARCLPGLPHPSGANAHRPRLYAAVQPLLTDRLGAWFRG